MPEFPGEPKHPVSGPLYDLLPEGEATADTLLGRFLDYVAAREPRYDRTPPATSAGEPLGRGFQIENVDRTCVRDVMTPAVFAVAADAAAAKVIDDLLSLRVHRLFVTGADGVLVGVISTVDILRRLRPAEL